MRPSKCFSSHGGGLEETGSRLGDHALGFVGLGADRSSHAHSAPHPLDEHGNRAVSPTQRRHLHTDRDRRAARRHAPRLRIRHPACGRLEGGGGSGRAGAPRPGLLLSRCDGRGKRSGTRHPVGRDGVLEGHRQVALAAGLPQAGLPLGSWPFVSDDEPSGQGDLRRDPSTDPLLGTRHPGAGGRTSASAGRYAINGLSPSHTPVQCTDDRSLPDRRSVGGRPDRSFAGGTRPSRQFRRRHTVPGRSPERSHRVLHDRRHGSRRAGPPDDGGAAISPREGRCRPDRSEGQGCQSPGDPASDAGSRPVH
jgi:hypothetical protein